MAIVFPTSLDTLTNPTASSTLTAVPHATQHADINDAVEAIEAKLGVDSSAVNTSIDYLLKNANSLNPGHKHNASNILMTTLVGTPTYTTQNDFNNSFGSTGRKTGGVGSDVGSSKVAVTGGTGFIKATDDDNAQLLPFDWAAPADITIPANSSRYIGIEYNAGTPQVVSRTTSTWDFDTEFPLLRVVNDTINGAEELYIANTQWWVTDGMTNVIQALRSFGLVRRDEYVGGLILSGTGTRNVAVSGGTVWAALNDTAFAGLDTAVTGTFEYYWYKAGSGWQKSDATQYSVLQYNDISQTTLQNLSANKYANVWVYGEMNATGISIALVYPQAQYNTAAEAESKSAPDNLPAHISQLGMLLGRYIIKQNVDAPISTQSVFSTKFSTSVVTSHANLSNLDYASAGHTGFAPIASPTFTGTVKMNDGSVDRIEVGGLYTYLRGNTVLPKTLFINDTSGDQQYELAVSELAGPRTITLPLLTGNDEFVFKAHTQTLTNKSIGGALTLEENASIDHDPSLSADGKYTGLAITGTAGATLAFGDLVTLDKDDSRWELVDISAAAAATGDARGIIGMCVLAAAGDGSATKILLNGVIRADTNFPTVTIGAAVYASTTGDIVVAQPTTADYVIRLVGYGLTADSIYFNPENDWITHV